MFRTRLIAGPMAGLVLSAVFATVATLVHSGDAVIEPLRVEPGRPAPVTLRLPPVLRADPSGDGRLNVWRPVVPRGSSVEDPELARLVVAHEAQRRPPGPWQLAALWLVYWLIGAMTTTSLRALAPGRGALLRTQVGLAALFLVLLLAAKAFLLLTPLPVYVIPVAAVPLWVALYLDRRSAFAVGLTSSLLAATLVQLDPAALAVFVAASLSAVLTFRDRKHPVTLAVPVGLYAALAAAGTLVAARTVLDGGFDVLADLADPWHSEVLAAAAGGALAGLAGYALHPLAVVALGAVSRSRLQELTDLDQPLLRKMAREAPGSWEHARAMANLAEQAASAIGADALLTRVGAYYHDLGKTVQPEYFIENLQVGQRSPHEDLPPEVSADAIMAHVVEGTRILREGGIPEPVVEFAYTHHGTSVIEYFWHKCQAAGNPDKLPRSAFRYPGMKPRTRETAILMIVDAVEAASRTVDDPDRDKFEQLVLRIVWSKLRQGQLDDSGLTMADLHVIVDRLVDTLCNVYHHRIKYPWQEDTGAGRSAVQGDREPRDSASAARHEPAETPLPAGTLSDADTTDDEGAAASLGAPPGPAHPGA